MKTIPASFCAVTVAWATVLGAVTLGQFVSRGHTEDVAAIAFWTGLFAFGGWVVAVLPSLHFWPHARLLHHIRWSWLGWMLLGVGSYAVLVGSWLGREASLILWYPAAMGGIAGPVFTWLTKEKTPDAS